MRINLSKNMKKTDKGITLIALVITIVVLLILAGVSIAMLTEENGILTQAQNAKTETEKAEEEEIVKLAVISAISKEPYGEITEEKLTEELNNRPGAGKYSIDPVEEGFAVTFTESERTYLVETDGNVIANYEFKAPEPEASTVASFTMTYGVIEVEFLSGTGYTVGNANNPSSKLKDGMEAIYWAKDASGEIDNTTPANNTYKMTKNEANYDIKDWYSYTAQTGDNDGKTSRWANAITRDGSYYVWIPRYAYRIVYFNTPEDEAAYREGTLTEEAALSSGAIVGYSDARGIVDKDGKRPTSVTSTTAISVNDKYFRVHPAFDGKPEEGGWDSKLEGLWVMKYEASKPGATPTSMGNANATVPMSVPNVQSWRSIKVSDMFTYAKNAYNNGETQNTTLNSHMMKNSEWGAVAYLTESKYGRNGTEISVNQCLNYITGAGRGIGTETDNPIYNSTYDVNSTTKLPEANQQYNGTVGQLSSTTGNIYGIYDISGGAWEYVMGFLQDENGNIHTGRTTTANSGFNGYLADESEYKDGIEFPNTEKKYYQLYKKTATDGTDLGEALYETKVWNSDGAVFVNSDNPVFLRSGGYDSASNAGAFFFSRHLGFASGSVSFRVCCAVK